MHETRLACSAPRVALILAGTLALAAGAAEEPSAPDAASHEMAGHDMAGMDHTGHAMSTARDEKGRSLYGMKHQMDPAMIKELREKVALYQNYSDAEINMSMDMMGHEYAWYISPPEVKGGQGVLILTHGFRDQGDQVFRQQVQPIGNIFPTALGIGMAMMMSSHIQVALDDLAAAGAREIVVLPVTSSGSNELYRQWLYIFGKQDKAEFASVPRVKTDAKIRFVEPPGDDPLVAEILLDRAAEISVDPKNEVVIIAGHGPSSAEDNALELKVLEGLARIMREDAGFAAVYGMTLQDDAPPAVREANVAKLRKAIEDATKSGKQVLIVTNLISARSIQAKLRGDLKGLEYKFNARGIADHPSFMKWMNESIRDELEKS